MEAISTKNNLTGAMDAADQTTEKERHMMKIKMANCASENDMQPIEKKKMTTLVPLIY